MVDDDVCSVCLDSISDGTGEVTACGHKFHTLCLDKWLLTSHPNPTCPECRKSIPSVSDKDSVIWGSSIVERIVRGDY